MLAVGLLAGMGGCSDGPSKPKVPPVAAALTGTFDPSALLVGDARTVTVSASTAAGAPVGVPPLQWTSDDPRIATVANGVVIGVAPGVTTVRARAGTLEAAVRVTVQQRPPVSIGFQVLGTTTPEEGDTAVYRATAYTSKGAALPAIVPAFAVSGGKVVSTAANGDGTEVRIVVDSLTTLLVLRATVVEGAVTVRDSAMFAVTEPVRRLVVYPSSWEARPGATLSLRVEAYGRGPAPLKRSVSYLATTPSTAAATSAGQVTAVAAGSGTVRVTVGRQVADVPVMVRAASSSPYPIDVRYIGPVPDSVTRASIAKAVSRWQRVMSAPAAPQAVYMPADYCGRGSPLVQETTSGVIILVRIDSIDGPGTILGSAGPCAYRNLGYTAALGIVNLDSADVRYMVTSGMFSDVIMHEMGHVLGIGTLWRMFGVNGTMRRDLNPQAGSADPRYTGGAGNAAAAAWGWIPDAAVGVAIENSGGGGTRDAHWRESTYTVELMTGWAAASSPLSAFTAASLRDLGYEVDLAGADVFLPSSPATSGSAVTARMSGPVLNLGAGETVLSPRWRLDAAGRPRVVSP